MNNTKPFTYKRVVAYLLDALIISVIVSLVTLLIPKSDIYESKTKELLDLTSSFSSQEITEEEYLQKSDELNYDINKNSVDLTLITCAISLLYFVIYNYYNNGVTVGKKIMKIKIVSANGKKLHLNNYLIRSLIVNSILVNIVLSIMVIFLSKKYYLLYYSKVNGIFTVVFLLCLVLIMYRRDGRGLHDLIANTMVIRTDENTVMQEITDVVQEESYKELPNTIQIDDEKEESKKKTKKKKKKEIEENPEGVVQDERV